MIFKTFDSDIDKISAKWGIFGKSFNDIGNAIVGRIKDINRGFQATDDLLGSFKDTDSIWKRLYPSKETIQSQMIDIEALFPKQTDEYFSSLLNGLIQQQNLINTTKGSWTEYFKNLGEGEKWQIEFVQNTDLQKASLDDVKKSYNSARDAAIAHNAALKQQTLGAKAASVAMKGLAIVGNMLMFWAITEGIQLAVKALDKLILTTEEAKESLDNSVSSFQGTTDELKNLESELETTSDRLRELQKLAENNSISIAEERELELLKQQNDELERKIALKKEEQVDAAKQVLKDAKKYSDKEVMSSYAHVSGTYEQGTPQYDSISAADELSIAFDKYYSSTNRPSTNQQNPKDVIENMYAVIEPTIEAYETLIDADYKLSNEEQAHYDKLRSLQDRYLQYRYDLNGLKETYQALSIEQQKNILLNRLTAQGLSDIQANAVLDSVSESDYASLWEKGFSFTPPQMTDYATAEEYGKAYANAWLNGVKSGVDAANETDILSFSDAWEQLKNSTDDTTKSLADNLTELAEKGQLTVEALSKADTTDFFENAGISAEEAVDKINALVSSSTQLQSMSEQISKMSDMLADKKNGTVASASDLAGFDVEVRGLSSWKQFEKLMGSSKSTMKECQAAANALATELVNSNNFLANLNETNKDYYITQLNNMGVENAEKIVTDSLASSKEALSLKYQALNALLTDFNGKTNGACQSLFNEQMSTDQARYALANLVSQEIIFNNTSLDVSGKISALNQLALAAYGASNALNSGMGLDSRYYTGKTAEERLAEKWNIISNANTSVQSTPVTVSPTGSSGYSSGSSGSKNGGSGAKDAAEETKEQFYNVFDWMERRIKRLQTIAEKAISKVTNSLQYAMDKGYVSNTFKKLNDQMKQNAYMVKRYQKSAKSSGLSQEWIDKIKGGTTIDYDHIYDEALANKIKEYEDWWQKSQDCKEANEQLKDSVKELSEAIAQAPIDKAAEKIEKLESATELINAKIENKKTANSKNKLIDKESTNIDKTLKTYKTAYSTSKSNLKTYTNKVTGQKVAKGATAKQKTKYKSLMAKVKSATKSGKAISDKVLESIFSYCSSVGNFSWYQNAIAYNEALTAKQSAEETYKLYQETSKTEKRELAKQKFDNVVAEYDNKIGLIDNGIKDIDNQLDIIEAKGQMANASYYEQQKVINADKLAQYKEEKTRLESLLPNIEQGTQEWYDAKEQIQECSDAISECEKTTYDLNNAIRELEIEKFEKIADQISRVSTEQEFLANLISHEQMYDDNGSFTEYGLATLGTYSSSYYVALAKANRDKAELEKLQNQLATGNLGTFNSVEQLQDRINELYSTWQDDISEVYSAQEDVFNMMSDKFDSELDALQELVDARKESLNLEKD